MARLRRRSYMLLFLLVLFVLGTLMGLKSLKPIDRLSDLDVLPIRGEKVDKHAVGSDVLSSTGQERAVASNAKPASSNPSTDRGVSYDVHIFYYTWYGNPQMDEKYLHWDHILVPHWDPKIAASYPRGRHVPPEDIGSSFYPELGPYSSRDPEVLESHMEQISTAGAGVVVLSWYPLGLADEHGEPSEDLVPWILDAALRHNLKVAFHIQTYKGRTERSIHNNVKYIIDRYGDHGAFYRFSLRNGKVLPLFYIYDSYLTPTEAWAELLTFTGSHSLRGSEYDGVFIALIVDEKHKHDLLAGGFDGMYTYFASNGFSYGSSYQNWKSLKDFCDGNNLLFVPSVGPGYIDTSIRPWNNHNTRSRVNGRYYETGLQAALNVKPEIISITSFNEWHEGTQIERAIPKKTIRRVYLDYQPHEPDLYLELTRTWVEQFRKDKE
ncbi:Glycoprotein endo-alpha-1,2-mannosidase-like protein [Bagarius yarrelli]|uniref:Glycoprotein endo-alpha-1,2-mannosidase-like protein n=1 Tax=Bagarius yarrelli TaxID=175774 RepID=A0A556TQD6_BAGYA|nr:Glycoprotein endo-alpha-1,2-mannosidase-like protein [Bagarius yarrelli]